jgi:uncharacterized membrane protein SpoIIM required for sporulation
VIIDLPRFLATERPYWDELERILIRLEEVGSSLSLEEVRRLHYLFERSTADLARLNTFAAEPSAQGYLEALVGRAYAWVHESSRAEHRFSFGRWLCAGFPETFRRHAVAFQVALVTTLAGVCFGALVVLLDPGAREVLMPFEGLRQPPAERVTEEESQLASSVEGVRGRFSAFLMTHNTRVAILALALGMTFGLGTLALLFYNGVILGAVIADYLAAGEGLFLAAWLLPHGSVEIPAILISGQAGLVLGAALLGRGSGTPWRSRLRLIGPELMTLVAGAALMLVWAGLVEAFMSQDHEPRLPYGLKIAVGVVELTLLVMFLGFAGRPVKRPWLRWRPWQSGEGST